MTKYQSCDLGGLALTTHKKPLTHRFQALSSTLLPPNHQPSHLRTSELLQSTNLRAERNHPISSIRVHQCVDQLLTAGVTAVHDESKVEEEAGSPPQAQEEKDEGALVSYWLLCYPSGLALTPSAASKHARLPLRPVVGDS
jgi:hypothetical protein